MRVVLMFFWEFCALNFENLVKNYSHMLWELSKVNVDSGVIVSFPVLNSFVSVSTRVFTLLTKLCGIVDIGQETVHKSGNQH